ncbi:MAG: sulfite exporter TauE/SafE family protein [Betaproteobacteria bacterium]|jgi:sulfite exporter TauE/SafE
MDLALALTGLLMGLAGAPHCAAMCGPACAALQGSPHRPFSRGGWVQGLRPTNAAAWAFHGMRVAGYSAAGAFVAAGVGLLAWAGQTAHWLRPGWALLHVAALALGLWLAITAQQPGWMTRIGRTRPSTGMSGPDRASSAAHPVRWASRSRDLRAGAAGSLWVAWPCGLLQSALVVAGLANTPAAGAAVMAAFAIASAFGLQLAPAVWAWWISRDAARPRAAGLNRLVARLTGALLALGSLWAMGHEVWGQVWAYCFA